MRRGDPNEPEVMWVEAEQVGRQSTRLFLLILALALGVVVLAGYLLTQGENSDDRPRPETPLRATPSTYEPPDPNRYKIPDSGMPPTWSPVVPWSDVG